jgi:hypothetical protein
VLDSESRKIHPFGDATEILFTVEAQRTYRGAARIDAPVALCRNQRI